MKLFFGSIMAIVALVWAGLVSEVEDRTNDAEWERSRRAMIMPVILWLTAIYVLCRDSLYALCRSLWCRRRSS